MVMVVMVVMMMVVMLMIMVMMVMMLVVVIVMMHSNFSLGFFYIIPGRAIDVKTFIFPGVSPTRACMESKNGV